MRVCISNENVCGWVEVAEWNKDDPSPSITIMWIISFRERKLKSKKSSSPDFIFTTTAAISCQAYLNRYAFNFIFTSSWCTFPNWWTNIFAPCCSRPTPSLCWAESKIWRKKSPFQSFLPCSRYLDIKKNTFLKRPLKVENTKKSSISPLEVGNTKQSCGRKYFFKVKNTNTRATPLELNQCL